MKASVNAPTILLLLLSLRTVFAPFPGSPRACSGGNSYGLYSANVCSSNCDANCCGLGGASNSACQLEAGNIVNNATVGSLLSLCAEANNGAGSCSASAFQQGAACVANIQQLQNLAAVCNLVYTGTITTLLSCMALNNITVNQLVSCCSTNGSGGVTCADPNFCSNTVNYEDYDYTNCCTVACGVYSY